MWGKNKISLEAYGKGFLPVTAGEVSLTSPGGICDGLHLRVACQFTWAWRTCHLPLQHAGRFPLLQRGYHFCLVSPVS